MADFKHHSLFPSSARFFGTSLLPAGRGDPGRNPRPAGPGARSGGIKGMGKVGGRGGEARGEGEEGEREKRGREKKGREKKGRAGPRLPRLKPLPLPAAPRTRRARPLRPGLARGVLGEAADARLPALWGPGGSRSLGDRGQSARPASRPWPRTRRSPAPPSCSRRELRAALRQAPASIKGFVVPAPTARRPGRRARDTRPEGFPRGGASASHSRGLAHA